jgi:FkbM family methyltransferase
MEASIRAVSSNTFINFAKKYQKIIFGRAKLIKAINLFRWKKADFLMINNIKVPLDLSRDTDLGHYLHDGIFYEQGLLQILCHLMEKKTVFYDIGANIGFYSLVFASNQKQVFMFEPNTSILKSVLPVIQSFPNLSLFSFGLSDKQETLHFHASSNHAMANFRPGESDPTDIKLEVFPLGEVIADRDLPQPEVMKIDVEGFEMKVLQGYGEENMRRHQPIILMEYIPQFANPVGYDFGHVKAFAEQFGYKIYRVENDGIIRAQDIDVAQSTSDVLLLPISKQFVLDDYTHVSCARA